MQLFRPGMFCVLLCLFTRLSAQQPEPVLRDTVGLMVFDSAVHHFAEPLALDRAGLQGSQLHKYFRFIGTEPMQITRVWTGDPHYICDYPREKLIPGQVYPFTVCFWLPNRQGPMHKTMGFTLADGSQVTLTFIGVIAGE